MEQKKESKTFIDKIWDLFASVKFAIIIFSLIALTSMVGTIIEQQAEPERNVKLLMKMLGVGHETAHSMLGVLDTLGFTDMYHSMWFLALLFLFAANLVICSIDRLPRIMKLVKEPIHAIPVDLIEKMSLRRTVSLKGKIADFKEPIRNALIEIGFKPMESTEGNSIQFYSQKGNFTRLGVYITHLSILVILIGAIIGIFFGFNAFLNLPEGEVSSVAYKERGVEVPLGFELRCDNFEVEFYEREGMITEMPKAYKSWLTVLENGKEVMKKVIEVNEPLKYKGITFYQSSYGTVPNSLFNGIFIFRAVSKDGKTEQVNARLGNTFTIPGTSIQGRIANFSPALAIDPSGKAFTYAEQMVNPAVLIEFTEGGKPKYSGWLLKKMPQTWSLPDGNRLEFIDYWGVEYTGMQVRKDPGVYVVYLGCIIMSVGLYITFFMSHRRIWVNISEGKNSVNITIGASAHRNKASFERKIEKMVSIIQADKKGGK